MSRHAWLPLRIVVTVIVKVKVRVAKVRERPGWMPIQPRFLRAPLFQNRREVYGFDEQRLA